MGSVPSEDENAGNEDPSSGERYFYAALTPVLPHLAREHRQHLRTTNPVESTLASLRPDAAKRYMRLERAIAVIWKTLMVVEKRFRRVNAPELIKATYIGDKCEEGATIQNAEEIAASSRLYTIRHNFRASVYNEGCNGYGVPR